MRNAALDLVITALEKIRETNDHLPRASKISLGRLEAPVPLTGRARPEPARRSEGTPEQSRTAGTDSRTRPCLHKMRASRLFADADSLRRRESGCGIDVHR